MTARPTWVIQRKFPLRTKNSLGIYFQHPGNKTIVLHHHYSLRLIDFQNIFALFHRTMWLITSESAGLSQASLSVGEFSAASRTWRMVPELFHQSSLKPMTALFNPPSFLVTTENISWSISLRSLRIQSIYEHFGVKWMLRVVVLEQYEKSGPSRTLYKYSHFI